MGFLAVHGRPFIGAYSEKLVEYVNGPIPAFCLALFNGRHIAWFTVKSPALGKHVSVFHGSAFIRPPSLLTP